MKKGTALRELGARYILNDMRRSANEENRSALPRVGTITLQDGNKWKTLLLVALLLAVGLYFLGRGVNQALTRQGGWTEIQARSGSPGCAGDTTGAYSLSGPHLSRILPYPIINEDVCQTPRRPF